MGRRIFEERNFILQGHVLPLEQYRLLSCLENGFVIPDFRQPEMTRKAESALAGDIPQLLAGDYMRFCEDGNRSAFEDKYFLRRVMLLDLTIGEYLEKKGRFTEKMIDVLWAILEESTWVIPAHNRYRPNDGVGKTVHANMPYAFGGNVDYIDLFSAATGAAVATAYYFHKDLFDAASPEINNRLQYELDRRLLQPYCDDGIMKNVCKWSGLSGNRVNNWCPWIVTNMLTVCAMTVENRDRRTEIVERSMALLDNFTAESHEDGGCDEGPRYWELAGGSLWTACLVLRDLTAGFVDVFDDPLLRNMGEYELKMIAANQRMLNVADAAADYTPNPFLLYHWGKTCQSEQMMGCAGWLLNGRAVNMETDRRTPYKYLCCLTTPLLPAGCCKAPRKAYIESLQIAVTRPSGRIGEGLYLAVKGGHNGESHNHNDLGSIVVYSDEQPVFVDAGAGEYTKRYFGPERYSVWHTCSDYHNCATFNGVTQCSGKEYAAQNVTYDPETGAISMSLRNAYPAEAGLAAYRRTAVLENEQVKLTDEVRFKEPGTVMLSFITVRKPEIVAADSFTIQGRTLCFDPSLVCNVEELDCTIPEAEPIPGFWGVDTLYRITLTTKEKITERTFVTSIR